MRNRSRCRHVEEKVGNFAARFRLSASTPRAPSNFAEEPAHTGTPRSRVMRADRRRTLCQSSHRGSLATTIKVSGSERHWDESSPEAAAQHYTYVAYIDDIRRPLDDASCQSAGDNAPARCSAMLPSMTPGIHRVQIAALKTVARSAFESERSASLEVLVTQAVSLPTGVAPRVHGSR